MTSQQKITDIHADLLVLRIASLKVITLLTGLLGYIWLMVLIAPETGQYVPQATWIAGGDWLCSRP